MFTKILTRPAFAIVISIILLFLGMLGIKTLPIAQFPDIAPPTVMVSISYPGASFQCPGRIGSDSAGAIHQRRPEHALHHLLGDQCR